MKKLTLVLSLVVALTLCMGAFSFSAAEGDIVFYGYAMNGDLVGTGTLERTDIVYESNGYQPVTAVGNTGETADTGINADGTITFGAGTNWAQTASFEQTSKNAANGNDPAWWAAPVASYSTAVTANQLFIPIIGGTGSWDGTPYTGSFEGHKVLCADDKDGVWTEIDFSAVAVAHDGSYMQADWGYGSILVYSFEAVTAKYFMVTFGNENVMFQRLMAMNVPSAAADTTVADTTVADTTVADTTEAEATDAVATTEAEATDAVATTEAVADETTGEGAADTADFAIASVALAAVAAAGVVLCSKKRK